MVLYVCPRTDTSVPFAFCVVINTQATCDLSFFLRSTRTHLSNGSDQLRPAGEPPGQSVQHRDRLHEALVGLTLLQVLPLR